MAKKKKKGVILTVGSKVKEHIANEGMRSTGDLNAAVSEQVEAILNKGIERAQANKRGTVKPTDL